MSFKWPGLVLISLITLISLGCASSGSKKSGLPDWVLNPPEQPGIAYGVGSAPVRGNIAVAAAAAKDSARVELLKSLRVQVSGQLTAETEERRATGEATRLVQSFRNLVQSRVQEVEIEGIELVESYHAETENNVYALVKLDRIKAAQVLRRDINQIDLSLIDYNRIPEQTDTFAELRQRIPALSLIAKREQLTEKLSFIAAPGTGATEDMDVNRLQQRIDYLLANLVVVLNPKTDQATRIAPKLGEYLAELGFNLSANATPDMLISFDIKLKPVTKGGTYYVFADGNVAIIDRSGTQLHQYNASAKGGSGFANLAEDKAIENLAKVMGEALTGTLIEDLK